MDLDRLETLVKNSDFQAYQEELDKVLRLAQEDYETCRTFEEFVRIQERVKQIRFLLKYPDHLLEQLRGS